MCHEGNTVYVQTVRGSSDKFHPVATRGDWVVCPYKEWFFIVHAPSGLAMWDPQVQDTFLSGYTICCAYAKVLHENGAVFPGEISRELVLKMNTAAQEAVALEERAKG